jgi:hypothetical protein
MVEPKTPVPDMCLTVAMVDFTEEFRKGARTVLERFLEGQMDGEWNGLVLDPAWYAPAKARTVYKRLHAEAARQGLQVYVEKRGDEVRLSDPEIFPEFY